MTEEKFAAAVNAYLAEKNADFDSALLTPDANLWDLGLVDSLRAVDLILFIEELTGREIDLWAHHAKPPVSIREMYKAYAGAGEMRT